MWTFRAYRFADAAAYAASLAIHGWQDGTPPGVDLLVTGTLHAVPVGDDTPGEALPGWHVAAAFRDMAAPAAWAAQQILPPEGMAVLGQPSAMGLGDYQAAIDAHVQATAHARSYNDANSCASYVVSTVPAWRAEAEAFVAWRDQVYLETFEALAAVQDGAPAPSVEGFVASLPAMVWPD
jgi:hypothetical protein